MSEVDQNKWAYRGLCVSVPKQKDYEIFKKFISEVLPSCNCNTLVLLIRYRYEFKTYPEVIDDEAFTSIQAAEIASLCRQNGIRIIPKINLFGHQSKKDKGSKLGLLRAFPDFDETSDLQSVRYCRSLCPRHPGVQEVAFKLIDELVGAFKAESIHIGMDEVLEIGHCPRCKGVPNSKLFADWVNVLHSHIVGKNKINMLMWGDRLLDGKVAGYGEFESSVNDTWPAIDMIPKDIILCDWHYGKREEYPSVDIFIEKGFKMVVCPWKELRATDALLDFALKNKSKNLLGFLATTWRDSGMVARYLCNTGEEVSEEIKLIGESFKIAMRKEKDLVIERAGKLNTAPCKNTFFCVFLHLEQSDIRLIVKYT